MRLVKEEDTCMTHERLEEWRQGRTGKAFGVPHTALCF